MELELRHLRILCAVADTGSATRAAATLGMTQPALTRQVQRIERTLGGPMFVRDRSGMHPTNLGEYVLARARAALSTVRDLQPTRSVTTREQAATPRIRVGSKSGLMLAGLLDGLGELIPHAEVTSEYGASARRLADLVVADRLDLALLTEFSGRPVRYEAGLVCHPILSEPVYVLLPALHRAASYAEVPLSELAKEDWVVSPPADDGELEWFVGACLTAGFSPRVAHRLDPLSGLDVVRSGRAVRLCARSQPVPPGVVTRPLLGTPLRLHRLLAVDRQGWLAPYALPLVEYVRAAYEEALPKSTPTAVSF